MIRQSGVHINVEFSEDYDNMQEQYEQYMQSNQYKMKDIKPKNNNPNDDPEKYPVNKLLEDQLLLLGNFKGKLLAKVHSVNLQPPP